MVRDRATTASSTVKDWSSRRRLQCRAPPKHYRNDTAQCRSPTGRKSTSAEAIAEFSEHGSRPARRRRSRRAARRAQVNLRRARRALLGYASALPQDHVNLLPGCRRLRFYQRTSTGSRRSSQ